MAFALISLYSLLSIIRLWKKKHLLSQPYFISLNFLVLMIGCFRAVYLLVDAYNSWHTFPHMLAYLLNSTLFPCITSMFSLLFCALLAATRMTFISKTVQKPRLILLVIGTHFTLSVVADVIIGLGFDARILLFVCQAVYIAWGLFLFTGFMIIFRRLYHAAISRQKLMNKYMLSRYSLSSKHQHSHKFTLGVGVKVAFVSALFGVVTVALLIYGMVDVYGVFKYHEDVDPWKWFAYNTVFRALELCMCITVSFVATQPFRYIYISYIIHVVPFARACRHCTVFSVYPLIHLIDNLSVFMGRVKLSGMSSRLCCLVLVKFTTLLSID